MVASIAPPPAAPAPPATDVGADRSLFGWYGQADGKTRRVFWTVAAGWVMDAADAQVYQYPIPLLITGLGITLDAGRLDRVGQLFLGRDRRVARRMAVRPLWARAGCWYSPSPGFRCSPSPRGFAQNYEQMLVIRVLHGLGFGAEWAVGAVLLGEMINPKHRGKALGAVQSGAPIGSGLAALLAGPIAASFTPDIGWRIAFWVGLLPALLILFVRRGSDDAEVYKAARQRQTVENRRPGLAAIFAPGLAGTTLLAALLSLGVQGGAYSVANYLTSFMTAERGLAQSVAGYLVLVNSAGGFFGCLANAWISDLAGRRAVFRLFGFGFLAMASIYLFGPWGANLWLLVPIGMVYGFFQFGMYASFGPYFTELFPTEMRGSGQAFAYNSGRAGAALFITGVPLVAAFMPLSAAMATLGIAGILCALVATLLLPETAGRRLTSLHDPEALV